MKLLACVTILRVTCEMIQVRDCAGKQVLLQQQLAAQRSIDVCLTTPLLCPHTHTHTFARAHAQCEDIACCVATYCISLHYRCTKQTTVCSDQYTHCLPELVPIKLKYIHDSAALWWTCLALHCRSLANESKCYLTSIEINAKKQLGPIVAQFFVYD